MGYIYIYVRPGATHVINHGPCPTALLRDLRDVHQHRSEASCLHPAPFLSNANKQMYVPQAATCRHRLAMIMLCAVRVLCTDLCLLSYDTPSPHEYSG